MTAYSKSSPSIWQKIRNLFNRGYEKVAAQELQIASAMGSKLSGIGYTLTRLVFFVIKLAAIVVLFWLALWLFIFMMAWIAFKFITFNRTVKQYHKTNEFSADDSGNKRSNTYDNNGNLLD
ncbi:hypothetical protein [Entomomonas asaccharolytica]|uniref:DUF3742 family protein n=1 Tax=Entomomonas asaccharolytica TaxID=2785331 RepID=A0A974NH52_9GAMM|nr:hypothetical protein [Entomomonas asaccharolytica]QQP86636.1 hypothetical protein JHT90_05195 [Entomomonas asaccharolytica]